MINWIARNNEPETHSYSLIRLRGYLLFGLSKSEIRGRLFIFEIWVNLGIPELSNFCGYVVNQGFGIRLKQTGHSRMVKHLSQMFCHNFELPMCRSRSQLGLYLYMFLYYASRNG